jgi:hypothetical protein
LASEAGVHVLRKMVVVAVPEHKSKSIVGTT